MARGQLVTQQPEGFSSSSTELLVCDTLRGRRDVYERWDERWDEMIFKVPSKPRHPIIPQFLWRALISQTPSRAHDIPLMPFNTIGGESYCPQSSWSRSPGAVSPHGVSCVPFPRRDEDVLAGCDPKWAPGGQGRHAPAHHHAHGCHPDAHPKVLPTPGLPARPGGLEERQQRLAGAHGLRPEVLGRFLWPTTPPQ